MVLAKKSEMRKNLLTGSTAGSLETSCLHLLIHCPHSISGTSDAAIVQVSCCWKRTCCLREMVSIISICWSVDRSNVKVVWLVIQSSKTKLGTHTLARRSIQYHGSCPTRGFCVLVSGLERALRAVDNNVTGEEIIYIQSVTRK